MNIVRILLVSRNGPEVHCEEDGIPIRETREDGISALVIHSETRKPAPSWSIAEKNDHRKAHAPVGLRGIVQQKPHRAPQSSNVRIPQQLSSHPEVNCPVFGQASNFWNV